MYPKHIIIAKPPILEAVVIHRNRPFTSLLLGHNAITVYHPDPNSAVTTHPGIKNIPDGTWWSTTKAIAMLAT